MKIVCSKHNLLKGVNTVLKAVPARTSLPILECILINTVAGDIKLTANDTELGIETMIEGNVLESGTLALDAKMFSEIIRKLPDNDITIESDASCKTVIKCEKTVYNIVGKAGDDFAMLPDIEKNEHISLSQQTLRDVIRQTIFSIAENDSNKLMGGELFDIHENELKVVSLDGHRVSIRKIMLKQSYADTKLIVPGKTLQEISKILNGGLDDEVLIYYTNNHVVFEFDETVVVSRLFEGKFFDINKMLSADYETSITINKKDLLDSFDRATLMVREADKRPILMNINEDRINLSVTSFAGTMDEEIEVKKSGKDLLIGFNPKFFIDALRSIDDEEINIYMVNPKAPCFIKDKNENYIYVILPVNFNQPV